MPLFLVKDGIVSDSGIEEQKRYIESTMRLESQQNRHRVEEIIETTTVPQFVVKVKENIAVGEGGVAHFEARLEPTGDPTLKVEWYKDSRILEASK